MKINHDEKLNFNASLIFGIWKSLNSRRRYQLFGLFVLMLLSALSEILSISAIIPFLSTLVEPENIWKFGFLKNIANIFEIKLASQLLIPITFFFIVAIILATTIRLLTLWVSNKLAASIGTDLSCKAYKRTIYQPYEVHLIRNTSSTIATTTSHINTTVVVLNLFLQLMTSLIISISLLFFLINLNYEIALITISIFGSAYLFLAYFSRSRLLKNSKSVANATNKQLKSLQEGLGAIRDVLLHNSQPVYVSFYQKADKLLRQKQAESQFLSAFPRYAFESIGLIMIAIIAITFAINSDNYSSSIPLLGTIALGAQKLLPSLQKIYGGWAGIKARVYSVFFVLELINQPISKSFGYSKDKKVCFSEKIQLKNVSFRYSSNSPLILKNINLEIKYGECIGIVGETGSGKSTLLDLLIGLLNPTKGELIIDSQKITKNSDLLKGWQKKISHVPQDIYLADIPIAENIAFGIPQKDIDMQKVKKAASRACISELIENLENGYGNLIGERGIRLSGGQRQRLGIARALYREPEVLIFDEGTSALDKSTEMAVMQSIYKLKQQITIIIVAHRLSTISKCNRIIRVENGNLKF